MRKKEMSDIDSDIFRRLDVGETGPSLLGAPDESTVRFADYLAETTRGSAISGRQSMENDRGKVAPPHW